MGRRCSGRRGDQRGSGTGEAVQRRERTGICQRSARASCRISIGRKQEAGAYAQCLHGEAGKPVYQEYVHSGFHVEPDLCKRRGVELQVPRFRSHLFFIERRVRYDCLHYVCKRAVRAFFSYAGGAEVVVLGSVNVYERDGKYQLYANEIILEGAGLLYEKFEALKQELEEMGMFAEEYKQPIPKFAKTVGS